MKSEVLIYIAGLFFMTMVIYEIIVNEVMTVNAKIIGIIIATTISLFLTYGFSIIIKDEKEDEKGEETIKII